MMGQKYRFPRDHLWSHWRANWVTLKRKWVTPRGLLETGPSWQKETGGLLVDTGAVGGVRAVRAGRAFHQAPTFFIRTSSPAPGWWRTSIWFYESSHLPKGPAGCVNAQRHEMSQRHFRPPRNPTGPEIHDVSVSGINESYMCIKQEELCALSAGDTGLPFLPQSNRSGSQCLRTHPVECKVEKGYPWWWLGGKKSIPFLWFSV